jgi:hypothetical protein
MALAAGDAWLNQGANLLLFGFCLPPVDFCNGVSPSQAAKWRPAGNSSAAGTSAVIAVSGGGVNNRANLRSATRSASVVIGRSEERTCCKIVVIGRLSALDPGARWAAPDQRTIE